MVLKTIFPGCGVRASLMLFFSFTSTLKLKTHSRVTQSAFMITDCLFLLFIICSEYICTVQLVVHTLLLMPWFYICQASHEGDIICTYLYIQQHVTVFKKPRTTTFMLWKLKLMGKIQCIFWKGSRLVY